MPLKPIFDKAPLTAMNRQALRAGLVRTDNATLKQLYALAAQAQQASALEGTFRLACIVTAKPDEEPVTSRIRATLEQQNADGSFDATLFDSIAILRAAWALYEFEARKPVLEHIARWCAWAAQHWDELMADDNLWTFSADLMELLENLYRVTGKTAVLTLCERVFSQTMVWSSVLNTVNTQRPVYRSVTREELASGLAREANDREGYYRHFLRANHPEQLADGARSAMAKGWYSGSATELNAARNGWERLERHHGAICGGLTADEMLEGTSPSAAMSTAALGAWAEALCAAAMGDRANWAWDALERMALNAMPATMVNGQLLPAQRVNTLRAVPSMTDCFRISDDLADRAVVRMTRGYAAVYASAVTADPAGFGVNLYLPGRYAVPVGEQLLILTIAPAKTGYTMTVHCKQDVKAAARLRIPSWSHNTEVTINGSEGGQDCTAGILTIERTWHDGDVLSINLEQTLRVMDGHHQGCYLLLGATVMVLPVTEDDWAYSLVNVCNEHGRLAVMVDQVEDWRRRDGVPADLPVLPEASKKHDVEIRDLTPYAQTPARIALFPRRKQA